MNVDIGLVGIFFIWAGLFWPIIVTGLFALIKVPLRNIRFILASIVGGYFALGLESILVTQAGEVFMIDYSSLPLDTSLALNLSAWLNGGLVLLGFLLPVGVAYVLAANAKLR